MYFFTDPFFILLFLVFICGPGTYGGGSRRSKCTIGPYLLVFFVCQLDVAFINTP